MDRIGSIIANLQNLMNMQTYAGALWWLIKRKWDSIKWDFVSIYLLRVRPWRTLEAGDEQLYQPHGKST